MRRSVQAPVLALLCSWGAAWAAPLVVGQVAPLTGLESTQGRAYSAGLQLCLNAANKAGGVNGNTFALAKSDDAGKPEETVTRTRRLIAESRPIVLAGYFGNRNLDELVASRVLDDEKIALVGYRVSHIEPESPYLFNVRASLRDEIAKITEHVSLFGMKRLGVVYQESAQSAALMAVADAAAGKGGATLVKASYPAGTAKVGRAVEAMLAANPQAVMILGDGAAAAGFIEQYRSAGGNARLFAASSADIEQISKRLGEEQMQGVSIAQVTPNPYTVRTRITKEFNDAVAADAAAHVPVSYAAMEGFIACKVILEAVRRQGGRPTREGMKQALEAIANLDVGGYALSYQPGMRTGSRFVELSIITASGKIRQ